MTFTNASIFALFVVTVAFTLPSAFLTTIGALIYAWFIWVCISIITFYGNRNKIKSLET
jgi:uncharacterized membrane protein